ncbi:hypothetical protein H6G00_08725 [Leptolyngbya sp. FACHB-541]|nr:hypothetical protein [Leptolyngbya sp. FACHB-541]
MHVWAAFFVIFLGMIELYQWLQGLTLPLPTLIVAGVLLAIASNRNKPAGLPWQNFSQPSLPKPPQPNSSLPTSQSPNSQSPTSNPQSSIPNPRPTPQLPNLTAPKAPSTPPQRSISFTIRKPGQN